MLDPNRTIAQGVVSEIITAKAGTTSMGVITFESADEIMSSNIAVKDICDTHGNLRARDIRES